MAALHPARIAPPPTRTAALLFAALTLAGCADLLPHAQTEVQATWNSFEEAKAAMDRFDSQRTTGADLRAAGLDPYTNPNVELLNYSDILRHFPLAAPIAKIDPGLRECLEAGKSCTGYSIAVRKSHRERVGPFLLDLLSFRRETKNTGWTFNAIVLLVDDHVVYSLYGGKPSISETEKTIEPLGPLQDWNGSGLIR
ncbi:MAG: hypothetical protein ACXWG1_12545 [Usitatibacter sp.]